MHMGAVRDIPQPHRAVFAAGGKNSSIRSESDDGDGPTVALSHEANVMYCKAMPAAHWSWQEASQLNHLVAVITCS